MFCDQMKAHRSANGIQSRDRHKTDEYRLNFGKIDYHEENNHLYLACKRNLHLQPEVAQISVKPNGRSLIQRPAEAGNATDTREMASDSMTRPSHD